MTIQTLRPNATAAAVGITSTSGSGAVHTDQSDNNDTTLTRGTQQYGYVYLDLADPTISGTQRAKRVRVRLHLARDAADVGGIEEARIRLIDVLASVFSKPVTMRTILVAQTEQTGPWQTASPTGAAWSNAIITALRVELTWYASAAGLFLRVAETFVDVDVYNQPVVTAPTVSGATTTTRPTWTTTYTGDTPQVRWQAKVFSAAQYGASNFSADTSPSTWDSGQVAGAATSGTVGRDLVNGVTYRLYVRAAMDWSGQPDGPYYWSAWQFTGFTIALIPPAAPSLALSTVATAPGGRVLADVTAPVNLLTTDNASFETGLGQTVSSVNCTISRVSTDAADGTWSMQMSSSAAGDMTARSGNEPFLGQHVKGGLTYTFLASFRAGATGRSAAVGARWQDAAGASIGADVYGSNITDTTTGYTQATATLVAPTNAKSVQVMYKVIGTAAAAELHRVDKADVHVGSSTVWTPGGSQAQLVTVERGERVESSRGLRDNWAHPDVASAGSVRMSTGYGFGISGDSGRDVLGWESLDKDLASAPSGMLHWQPRSAAAAALVIGSWPYGGPGSEEWRFPVLVGSTHVVSFWAWVGSGTLAVTPNIDWIGQDMGTILSSTAGSPITLTTTPQQVVLTGTAPASAAGAQANLTNHTSNATADIYLTRVGWGLGSAPVDDRPAAGGPLVWTPVRNTAAVQPAGFPFGYDTGQRLVFADWEAPPGRPLLYRAQLTATLGGTSLSSPYSTYGSVLLAVPGVCVLKDPRHPETSIVVAVSSRDPKAGVAEDVTRLDPLGRDRDPVFARDWVGGEDWTLTLIAKSEAELYRIRLLLLAASSLLLQWPTGGQHYGRVVDRGYVPVVMAGGLWEASFGFVQTAAP